MSSGSGLIPDDDRLSSGTQSISRAVAVLRLLGSGPTVGIGTANGVSLSELVERSGLIKSTCRRILIALMEAGLAEQDLITRRYYLGPEAYVLGTIAAERYGIHRLALEGVTRLAKATGDAAFIQVRRGFSVVCLHREDGAYPIRSHVLASGDRHILGAGAGGLALLAALSDKDVELALAANADSLARHYPMLSRDLLLGQVRETRRTGYSLNPGLLFPGSWGMGMVVRDQHGNPEACLSLAAVENRMQPDRQPELAALLAEEVRRIEPHQKEQKQGDSRLAETRFKSDTQSNAAA
jgi:DNA-binding IclR family transcriptional regulator